MTWESEIQVIKGILGPDYGSTEIERALLASGGRLDDAIFLLQDGSMIDFSYPQLLELIQSSSTHQLAAALATATIFLEDGFLDIPKPSMASSSLQHQIERVCEQLLDAGGQEVGRDSLPLWLLEYPDIKAQLLTSQGVTWKVMEQTGAADSPLLDDIEKVVISSPDISSCCFLMMHPEKNLLLLLVGRKEGESVNYCSFRPEDGTLHYSRDLDRHCSPLASVDPSAVTVIQLSRNQDFRPPPAPGVLATRDSCHVIVDKSQFDYEDGRSACTFIAFTAAMILGQLTPKAFDEAVVLRILDEGVQNYRLCKDQLPVEHAAPEEVLQLLEVFVPRPGRRLSAKYTCQGLLSSDSLLSTMSDAIAECAGRGSIVLTKPPETVLVQFTVSTDGSQQELFLFDSHPRPYLGLTGSSLIQMDNIKALAEELLTRLPPVDIDPNDWMQAQMLNMFEVFAIQLEEDETSS